MLLKYCSLKVIDISKCVLLTSEGIQKFLEKVSVKLEVFIASHLKCVSNTVMDSLFRFSKLNVLDLSYNTSLTQEFFDKLSTSSIKLNLKILKLDGIKCMTSALLDKVF
jgi:hypothetical protein